MLRKIYGEFGFCILVVLGVLILMQKGKWGPLEVMLLDGMADQRSRGATGRDKTDGPCFCYLLLSRILTIKND